MPSNYLIPSAKLSGTTQSILTLDILSDGKYLVTYGIEGEIVVWSTSTYAIIDGKKLSFLMLSYLF